MQAGSGLSRMEDMKDSFLNYLKDVGILHNHKAQSLFMKEKIPSTAKMVFLLANYISELDPSSVFDLSQKIFENWRFKIAKENIEDFTNKRPRFKTYSVGNLKLLENKNSKESYQSQNTKPSNEQKIDGVSFGVPNDIENESINVVTMRKDDQKERTKESTYQHESPTARARYTAIEAPIESNFGTFGNVPEARTRTRSLMDFHKDSLRIRRSQAGMEMKVQKENVEELPIKSYEYERLMNLKQRINEIRDRIGKEPQGRRRSSHYRESLTSLYTGKQRRN